MRTDVNLTTYGEALLTEAVEGLVKAWKKPKHKGNALSVHDVRNIAAEMHKRAATLAKTT
jgi:hypothetical protein